MVKQNSLTTPWEWTLVRLIVGLSIGFFILLYGIYGSEEEGFRHLIRWSARISFTLFCMAFGASAVHHLIKNSFTWWLRMNRKFVGISFAIIHLIHLVFLIVLQNVYHPVFDLAATSSLVGGGIAYFFVVMMLATSFERGKSWLSPNKWRVLHTIGGYWIWSIYMTTYFKRADTEPIHWIPVGILLFILFIRVFKLFAGYRMRTGLTALLAVFFLFNAGYASAQEDPSVPKTVLIKNGIIYDGSGSRSYPSDLFLEEGRITAILERPHTITADLIIDAEGLVVSPGFIDIHAHGNPMETPEFKNFLAMGVTTIALGMDGSSPSVSELSSWMKEVQEVSPGVNILPFIGHNTLRRESGIGSSKEVSNEDLSKLRDLIHQAFNQGCWGLSMGLEYLPGYYAGALELKEIAKTVGVHNGMITAHIRNEDDEAIEASIQEMINLSAYCPINISHIKVVYGQGRQRASELLDLIRTAQDSGFRMTADFYPYTASYTGIGIVFPEWAKNPKKYAQIKQDRGEELLAFLRNKIQRRNGPEATLFGTGPYKGKTLKDLVDEYNLPYEVILRDIIGPYGASAAYFVMDDELQKKLMLDNLVAIGSDGSPTMHHPRGYGSFAKVIEEDVRVNGLLTLERAIYKMSGLPAQIVGLTDRGLIKQGNKADLLIFDPEKIASKATFSNPHELAIGITHVFINGHLVKDGEVFNERKGLLLLRTW